MPALNAIRSLIRSETLAFRSCGKVLAKVSDPWLPNPFFGPGAALLKDLSTAALRFC